MPSTDPRPTFSFPPSSFTFIQSDTGNAFLGNFKYGGTFNSPFPFEWGSMLTSLFVQVTTSTRSLLLPSPISPSSFTRSTRLSSALSHSLYARSLCWLSPLSAHSAVQQVVIAGAAERCRMLPVLVFLFLWASIVYCPYVRLSSRPRRLD